MSNLEFRSSKRPCLEALAAQGVQLVALRCTGFNNVDVAAAKELGLTVTRVPVYSPYAVAEHAVALLLTLNRKLHRAFNRVRELNFSLNGLVGFDLHGKTAGIVGTGKIGRIVARILHGFGMRVIAYDPFPVPDWAAGEGVEYLEPSVLASSSDVISLHIPLTMIGILRTKPGRGAFRAPFPRAFLDAHVKHVSLHP